MQPESDKPDGEAWEDLGFPNNETDDDDAEVVVIPGRRVEVPPLGGGGGREFKRSSTKGFPNSLRRLRPYIWPKTNFRRSPLPQIPLAVYANDLRLTAGPATVMICIRRTFDFHRRLIGADLYQMRMCLPSLFVSWYPSLHPLSMGTLLKSVLSILGTQVYELRQKKLSPQLKCF